MPPRESTSPAEAYEHGGLDVGATKTLASRGGRRSVSRFEVSPNSYNLNFTVLAQASA